jgi:hypothetical protein
VNWWLAASKPILFILDFVENVVWTENWFFDVAKRVKYELDSVELGLNSCARGTLSNRHMT